MKSEIPANLVWHATHVAPIERQRLLGQTPVTLWLTGLSGAGKSTLATALEAGLVRAGHACFVLDGDNVRHGLNRDIGFSDDDRRENIRRIAHVASLFNDAGLIVITAFISPFRADREMARQIIGPSRFREIHVSTPLAVCEDRDTKGFYARARRGELPGFTGIDSPYEPPANPDLAIDTSCRNLGDCVAELLSGLRDHLYPPGKPES